MSWVSKNQPKIAATREFLQYFAERPTPLQQWVSSGADLTEQVLRSLCANMLWQQISQDHLQRFLQKLFEEFPGLKLADLPAPAEQSILDLISAVLPRESWAISAHVPGIIWGVGSYYRQHITADLQGWLQGDLLQLWRSLSQVYFSGKSSPIRPKILRALDVLRWPYPLGLGCYANSHAQWPNSISPGAQRWMQKVGPGKQLWFKEASPKKQLQHYQELYKGLHRLAPQLVAHGLAFYLEPVGKSYACRNVIGNCSACPLFEFCPSKKVNE